MIETLKTDGEAGVGPSTGEKAAIIAYSLHEMPKHDDLTVHSKETAVKHGVHAEHLHELSGGDTPHIILLPS